MITINKLEDNTYEVIPEPITISVNKKFRISSSYNYAGIDSGIVSVVDLVTKEEYENNKELYPSIQEFMRIEVEEMELLEEKRADYRLWVSYEDENDVYCLPIDVFLAHTSMI